MAYVQIFLHISADTVTINHQTEIQFPRGEFYYMGTLSEFAVISLWSLCVCEHGACVFVFTCVYEICLSGFVYMPGSACTICRCVLQFQWRQTVEVFFF